MTDGTQWRIEEIGMPIGGYPRWAIYMSAGGKDTLYDHYPDKQAAVNALEAMKQPNWREDEG